MQATAADDEHGPRSWQIGTTREFARWFQGLSNRDADRIGAAIRMLEQEGPFLGGGVAKRIKTSRHHNMKELRSVGGHIRVLLAFDPRQRGVLLVGGDKTNNWNGWYKQNIPKADKLLDDHLRALGKEGNWRNGPPRTGGPSDPSR